MIRAMSFDVDKSISSWLSPRYAKEPIDPHRVHKQDLIESSRGVRLEGFCYMFPAVKCMGS